ncbi:hypothetical protein GLOIN_2v1773059 [Rhizophagus clarus]|uniref:Uncharacterized protein n=1 Tax=Rhizophagus clarus TaxID=94130 RepID=A0A8H3L674_9GLOM|nr:hypothetical protein GLOIN_2v1773059 [Rhizophagus clarus]
MIDVNNLVAKRFIEVIVGEVIIGDPPPQEMTPFLTVSKKKFLKNGEVVMEIKNKDELLIKYMELLYGIYQTHVNVSFPYTDFCKIRRRSTNSLLRKCVVTGAIGILMITTLIPIKFGTFRMRPFAFYFFKDVASGIFAFSSSKINLSGLTEDEPTEER